MQRFRPLDPAARRVFTWSFARDLRAGDRIVGVTFDVALASGADDTPDQIWAGDYAVSGADVMRLVNGRPAGNAYGLKCMAETERGEVLTLAAVVTMVEGA